MSEASLFAHTSGPRDAKIMIVGESWGSEEKARGTPFVGFSGQELDRMLSDAGLSTQSVFKTNVFNDQPRGNDAWRFFETNKKANPTLKGLHPTSFVQAEYARLHKQIAAVSPEVVIAAGNYALWATTSCASTSSTVSNGEGATVRVPSGIGSYRGSMLFSDETPGRPQQKVLPLLHPAAIMRQWGLRSPTIHDLRTRIPAALSGVWRPSRPPSIVAQPDFQTAHSCLSVWLNRLDGGERFELAHDIETSRGLITCMGFADGPYDESGFALVIPLVRPLGKNGFENYWTVDEETTILALVRRILTHPNVILIGQNYLYDIQYCELFLGCQIKTGFDTMLAHHLVFPGTPKGLDYLSSLYCKYHWYWKDDLKEWDTDIKWETNLIYNGTDCLRTWECAQSLKAIIKAEGMESLWEMEKTKADLALRMMRRGVRIDRQRKSELGFILSEDLGRIHSWLATIIPQAWLLPYLKTSKKSWYESPKQQQLLFYELLGLDGQRNRKTGNTTINFEAIETLKVKNPEYTKIFNALLDARSIAVFHNTFVQADLEPNGRMKCSFNPAGPETFRWSSSANAFGRGTNLQNIPSGDEE